MNSESSVSTALPDPGMPPSTAQPRRRRHWWIWAVVLALFGLLFYWVIAGNATNPVHKRIPESPVPVVTATAKTASLGVYLESIGTVTPVYTDSINAQATGVITAVHYRQGQFVHRGDPLIDIDPRPYAATLMEAQGNLERDLGLLAEARMDMKRYQLAWARNAIPRQTLDDQVKLVQQDEGTVKADQGTVAYDKVQLSYCHIVAPISGQVGLRLIDPGNLVTANSPTTLVVITQMKPITVIFTIAEDSLPEVLAHMRHGAKLVVQAWDRTDSQLIATGKLVSVDNQIDTTTGTIKLRARFRNLHEGLYPNQFVNVRLLVTTLQNQTTLPTSAIQHKGNQAYVFLLKPGPGPKWAGSNGSLTPDVVRAVKYHVIRTDVTTGVTDKGMTGVQGIHPGDLVADTSFQKLVNGSEIYISHVMIPNNQVTINGESSTP